ncbi:hypothetical protein OIO90_004055 [Microbotryomycetes sp. JL221]|nr:hypothetical protein OIO90_004055 [Microbotryomycetes sp. JL221]
MPDNANPVVHKSATSSRSRRHTRALELDDDDDNEWHHSLNTSSLMQTDAWQQQIDKEEVFDLIRSISDPEHPLTLEQLAVVSVSQITVTHGSRPHVLVEFTPTIPHCSMATLIGLSLRVRLLRSLPERFKVDIKVKQGTHQSENAVNKQLNDKERVAGLSLQFDCVHEPQSKHVCQQLTNVASLSLPECPGFVAPHCVSVLAFTDVVTQDCNNFLVLSTILVLAPVTGIAAESVY